RGRRTRVERRRRANDRGARPRRLAWFHRPAHALRHRSARRRHCSEQGAPGRHARRHGREHVGGAARRVEGRGRQRRRRHGSRRGHAGLDDVHRLLPARGAGRRLDHLISHVSSEQVRRVVMGYDARPATPAELDRMKKLVARSMEEGAWGLVTRFESGGPDHPAEIVELARVVASYGGNYTSHVGSEGFEQEQEIPVAIRLAEELKIPVHIFHLKIRARDNWGTVGKYVRMIEEARSRGLDVTANQYPYTAMNHGWSAFFPVWAREGGPAKFAERLRDPAVRERIKTDKDFIAWAKEHGWWEGIVMGRAGSEKNRRYEGMRVSEIAKQRGDADPADTCLTLMA